MKEWKLTRVWNIENQLVVAKTINEAIELWKVYVKTFGGLNREPENVVAVSNGSIIKHYDALIKEEKLWGKIILRIFIELLVTCLLITIGVCLLQKFVW